MLQKYWFYLVGFFSLAALTSALIAEFYFNLAPCEMCLKQREPYYIIILGFIFIAILRWQRRIWFYLGVQLISIYGLFYSVWHVGIENQLLPGPAGCSSGLNTTNNILEHLQIHVHGTLYYRQPICSASAPCWWSCALWVLCL